MGSSVRPIGLTVADFEIRIEGYPNAERLVELTSPLARRLTHLRLHQQVLLSARKGFLALAVARDQFPDAADSILVGIVTKLFSCFGDNKSASPLAADKVFRGNAEALYLFRSWKSLRDKHFAHNESELSYLKATAVLGPEGEVQDIVSLNLVPAFVGEVQLCATLGDLIDATLDYVVAQASEVVSRLFAETRDLSREQREALETMVYSTPGDAELFKTRGRS